MNLRLVVAVGVVVGGCQCGRSTPAPDGGTEDAGGLGASLNGRVLGRVRVAYGAQTLELPGATVWLQSRGSTERLAPLATSGGDGHFEVPPHAPGEYELCAEAPGLAAACDAMPLVLAPDALYEQRDVTLTAPAGAVRGTVLLSNNLPCFRRQSALLATVTVGSTTVTASAAGAFLLSPGPAAGPRDFVARCGSAEVTVPVMVGTDELSGARAVDLVIPNAPPRIELASVKRGAVFVRRPDPGDALTLSVDAVDPDGDTLHYAWTDGSADGGVTSLDASSIPWTAPSVAGRSAVSVVVSDGKGGFADTTIEVLTSDTGDRVLGTVTDATGAPIAGATVAVDAMQTTTDAAGEYRLAVPEGERHTVSVKKPTFAPFHQIIYGPALGLDVRLKPAVTFAIDPTQRVTLEDGTTGASVDIPAGSLFDPVTSMPAAGPLTLAMHTYRLEDGDLPGDRAGRRLDSTDATLHGLGGVAIEVTDATGKVYNLGPGKVAHVGMPAPATGSLRLPRDLIVSHFDEASGVWEERGPAQRTSAERYTASVSSFSQFQFGSADSTTACVRIDVDPWKMQRPLGLRVDVYPYGVPIEATRLWAYFTVTDATHVVYRLPPNALVELRVTPLHDLDNVISTTMVYSGGNVSPAQPGYPYSQCARATLTAQLPASSWLDRFEGSEIESLKYYLAIGAIPNRASFALWKQANGFTAADAANDVVVYNERELGLARRINCRHEPSTDSIACYITKCGHVGEAREAALDDCINGTNVGDTVAMEFAKNPNAQKRFTRFYIYRPDGALSPSTYFDTSGPKYVPESCEHCHARHSEWRVTGGDVGGQFIHLDVNAYRYKQSGPYTLAAQQERLRQLNSLIDDVANANPGGATYHEAIVRMYPSPNHVFTPGSVAQTIPTPDGWTGAETLYDDIVGPSCRTCHRWQSAPFDFAKFKGMEQRMAGEVCFASMPNAMNPMLRLWRTTNPHLPDVFSDWAMVQRCSTPRIGHQPTVSITSPSGGLIDYGGLGFVDFTAATTDAEDGSSCCDVKWSTDVDGVIGHGKQMQYVFPSPGGRTVTAQATDNHHNSTYTTMQLTVRNSPPVVTMVTPAVGQTIFTGVPYGLQASATDINEPLGKLPCASFRWTSNSLADTSFPKNGCLPAATFTAAGTRTLTVTGTDSQGAATSVSRVITVTVPPPNQPPVVHITSPGPSYLPASTPVTLSGIGVDPDGTAVVLGYRWAVRRGMVETTIGNTPSLMWTPSNDVSGSCNSISVELRLYVTDSDGTGYDSVLVDVGYPPC